MSDQAIPSAPSASVRQLRLPAIEVGEGLAPLAAGLAIIVGRQIWSKLPVSPQQTVPDESVGVQGVVQGILGVHTITLSSLSAIAAERR